MDYTRRDTAWGIDETKEVDNEYKLKGEREKIILELQDLDWRIEDVINKEKKTTILCIVGILIAAITALLAYTLGGPEIFDFSVKLNGLLRVIRIFLCFEIVIVIFSILIYICTMSSFSPLLEIASFFKIEKLEFARTSYVRQKKALEKRLKEIDKKLNITTYR